MKTDPEQKGPLCPTCGKPMKLARVISQVHGPDMESFECHFCGVTITQAVQRK
jgi:hypothetical protein